MQMQPVDLLGPPAPRKGAGGAGTGNATSPFHAVQQQAMDKKALPPKGQEKDVLQATVPPDSPREPFKESSPTGKDPDETAENAAQPTVAFPQNAGGEAPGAESRAARSSGETGMIAAALENVTPGAAHPPPPSTPSLDNAAEPTSGSAPEPGMIESPLDHSVREAALSLAKIDLPPGEPAEESAKPQARIDSPSAQTVQESIQTKAKITSPPGLTVLEPVQPQAKTSEKAASADSTQTKEVYEKIPSTPAAAAKQGAREIPAAIRAEVSPAEQPARPNAGSFLQMDPSQGEHAQAGTQAAALSQAENIKGKDTASSTSMGRMFSEIIGNIKPQESLRQENPGAPTRGQETPSVSLPTFGATDRVTLEETVFSGTGARESADTKPFGAIFGQGQSGGINGTIAPQGNEGHFQPLMPATSSSTQSPDAAALVRLPSGTAVPESQVLNGIIENMAVRIGPLKETNSITIRLQPEELGRLKIELEVNKESVRAHLIAQNQHSHDILERNLPRLREALEQQGLRLDDIQVDIESGHNAGSRGSFEEHRGSAFRHTAKGASPANTPEKTATAATTRPAWTMGQGGLSMHI